MNERKNSRDQQARLKEFLERRDIRDLIGGIESARGRLREIGSIGNESPYGAHFGSDQEEIDSLLDAINRDVVELQEIISRNELFLPQSPEVRASQQGKHWSLGAESIRGPLIPILRGELEPVRRVVVAPNLPVQIVLFFLSIPRIRDLLVRERHGPWGYHYHYLDSNRRRSDTLLTFEQQLRKLPGGQQAKVLTWERHSEKSHFSARAASWGAKKRESVYQSCVGDSAKRSLSDFKTPGKDAEVVWPV